MDIKETLQRLLKIAQVQQKALEKLAQTPTAAKSQSDSSIWYGKLDPNDPRQFDPLYGGETPPDQPAAKPAPKPVAKPAPQAAKPVAPAGPAPTKLPLTASVNKDKK